MTSTPLTILVALESISYIFLILRRGIIFALTFCALKGNNIMHTLNFHILVNIKHFIQQPQ